MLGLDEVGDEIDISALPARSRRANSRGEHPLVKMAKELTPGKAKSIKFDAKTEPPVQHNDGTSSPANFEDFMNRRKALLSAKRVGYKPDFRSQFMSSLLWVGRPADKVVKP